MAQRKLLFQVHAISDCGTGMYRMGEIDAYPSYEIENYILHYGDYGVQQLQKLALTILCETRKAEIKINEQKQSSNAE